MPISHAYVDHVQSRRWNTWHRLLQSVIGDKNILCCTINRKKSCKPQTDIHKMAPYRDSLIIATTLLTGAAAINNGLAVTPPMGWVR